MSSYRIIHNASKILSRVSAHGLPETAAIHMTVSRRLHIKLLPFRNVAIQSMR